MKRFLLMLLCLLCSVSMLCAQADITLPRSLTVIGEEAFAGDSSIAGLIEVPDHVYRIQAGAFSGTKLTGLNLPSSVSFIEDNIISGSPVTWVAVVNPDAELSEHALDGTSVIISREGSTAHAWANANGVEWYNMSTVEPSGEFFYEFREDGTAKLLFAMNTEAVSGNITIPILANGHEVTEISEYAFSRCYGLQSVSIPDSAVLPENYSWPENLEVSVYSTGAEPDYPDEEYVKLNMPEPHIYLPVGMDYSISWPEGIPEDHVAMFYSSDSGIVSVDSCGNFVCHSLGDAAITMVVRTEANVYAGVVQVHVVEPEVEISMGGTYQQDMVVGQTTPISVATLNTNLSFSGFIRSTAVFESSDENVFIVDEDAGSGTGSGYITTIGAGTADLIVTVSYGEQTWTERFPITVHESDLGLNYTYLYTYSGLNEQLVLRGDTSEIASVEWSSDDETIVTIDQEGLITAHEVPDGVYEKDFTANTHVHCNVTYNDGNTETFDCYIAVYDRDPMIIVEEDPMGFYPGETGNISDLPVYMDWWWVSQHNSLQPEAQLTFTSEDDSIISFNNEAGTFEAHEEGEVKIHVEGYANTGREELTAEGTFTAEIYRPTLNLWLNEEWDEEDKENEEDGFWYIDLWMSDTQRHLEHDMDHELMLTDIEFTSDNPSVVKVSSDGYLQGISAGEANVTMTITDEIGQTASATARIYVHADTFEMDLDAVTLNVGEAITLTSLPELPEGVTVVDDHFWSDDDSIATFDSAMICGISAGSTYVFHEINLSNESSIIASTLVTVVDPECPVKLNASAIELEYSHTYQLEATIDGEADSIKWWSDDEGMATVDENGLITLVDTWDHGHFATVYCTAVIDGKEYTAGCTVTCPPLRVWFRWFWWDANCGVGEECLIDYQLSAEPGLEYDLVWSTDDPEIATIDENGVMTGHSAGVTGYKLEVVDADGNVIQTQYGTAHIATANEMPTGLSLNRKGYLITYGENSRYCSEEFTHVDVHIESEFPWDHELLRYSSDNEEIVTIDGEGNLQGHKPGMANITVTMAGFPGVSATAPVIVAEDVWLEVSTDKICVGEELTIGLKGMPFPEGDHYRWMLYTNHNIFKPVGGTGEGDLIYRWIRDENFEFKMDLYAFGKFDEDDYYNYYDYEDFGPLDVLVESHLPEYPLNETVLYLWTGEEYDLYPQYDRNVEYDHWEIDDEDVATYDWDNGRVIAKNPGECTVTFTGVLEDGTPVTSTCDVIVSDPTTWRPVRIETPDTLTVGQHYGAECYVYVKDSYLGNYETRWEVSDESILSYDEDENILSPLRTGKVDLTCYVTKNDETQALTKTIRVVELPAYMSQQYVELRPGKSAKLDVISSKEIASVEWKSSCEANVTVDQDGNVTAVNDDGLVSIYAFVTFADGTTATAHAHVDIVCNEDIWLNFYHFDNSHRTISIGGITEPEEVTVEAYFSTNAHPDDFLNNIEWVAECYTDSGEEIDTVELVSTEIVLSDSKYYHNQYVARVTFKAAAAGDAYVFCTIHNPANYEEFYHQGQAYIRVDDPYFAITSEETSYTLRTGETRYLSFEYDERGGYGHISPYITISSDPDVVSVNGRAQITGLKPGTATVTHYVYSNTYDRLLDSIEFDVTVEGVVLNEHEITLNKGETANLWPDLTIADNYDNYEWSTSNPDVAVVSRDGIVMAVGAGSATITYRAQLGGGDAIDTCLVHVPAAENEPFMLTDTAITAYSEETVQMAYVSSIGEPEKVEWRLSNYDNAEISEDGVLTVYDFDNENRSTVVVCIATINGEEYIATCDCTLISTPVWINGFDGVTYLSSDNDGDNNEEHRYVNLDTSYKMDELEINIWTDNDAIAKAYCEDDHVVIKGVSEGETIARYSVKAPTGRVFEKTVTVYVDCAPSVEEFEVLTDRMLLFMPHVNGWTAERHIQWNHNPGYAPIDVHFESEDTNVVTVDEEGYVRVVGAGKTNIKITLPEYPQFNTILPVLVARDSNYTISGLGDDNTIKSGEEVQLKIESTDDWHTYAHDIEFYTHYDGETLEVTEDGLLYARHPSDDGKADVWIFFNLFGDGWEDCYEFNIACDEEYVFAWHDENENIVFPGQEFWPDVRNSFDIHGWKVTSDNEAIIKVSEDGGHWIAVAPGEATLTYTPYYRPDENSGENVLHPTITLTSKFTVKEPENFVATIETSDVMYVGDTHTMCGLIDKHYYNGPDWDFFTSDENLLRYDGWSDEHQSHMITAVAPGTAYLTAKAYYGDTVAAHTIAIQILEKPVYVNNEDVTLRPGKSKQLILTPVEGKEIKSVEWKSSCPDYVSVDGDGVITAGTEGHAQIMAYVTFTDDSFFTTTTKVGIAQNEDLWIDENFNLPDGFTLGTNEAFGPATSADAEVYFHSSMAEGEPQITWTSSDESIVKIGDSYCTYDPQNDGAVANRFRAVVNLNAVSNGSAEITVTVASEFGQSVTQSFWVNVVAPTFEINSNDPAEFTMQVNERRNLDIQFGGDWQSQFSYYTLNSSNEGIVSVNCHSTLTGVAPGPATITVAAYSDNSRLMATRDFQVTVEEPVIALNETELTLTQGTSTTLTPSIPEGLEISNEGWYSDDNNVALVASNGTVIATGVGQTRVYYSYYINEDYFEVPCHVNVPYAENGFKLNESSIMLAPGASVQLSYVCEETPDSVVWSVNNEGNLTVDQEGNVTAHGERYYAHDMVYCTATFGNEVRIAGCYVKPATSGVWMNGIGEMHGLSSDEEYYLGVEYCVIGDITANLEWYIEDESVADIFMTDDAHVWIRGKQSGVTGITIAVVGSDGSRYEERSTIYVDCPVPVIEEIHIHENPMVINVGEDRWIPRESVPSGEPYGINFFCLEENDIVNIHDYDWIEGLNPGRVTVRAQANENPDCYVDFDVIVLGEPTFTGLENDTLQAGAQAQLDYSFGDVNISGLNFTFRSDEHHGTLGFYSDSNTVEGREPGEFSIWLDLNGYDRSYEYRFTVERPDGYFYAKYQEFVMYEGQVCGLEYYTDYVDGIRCTFSEEGIAEYSLYDNNLTALAPGETTVTITGNIWNEENEEETFVPCLNQMHIVVVPAEPLDFEISSPNVLTVGEEHDVWIHCESKQSTFDPAYTSVSSDPSILSIADGYRMVAHKAGQVTLTVTLGEGENATVRETTIYVLE